MEAIHADFALTEEDIKNYREKGFVLLKQLFSEDMIDHLKQKVKEQMSKPTDKYQQGFDKVGYGLCNGDPVIYNLLADPRFSDTMLELTEHNLFFTQGLGFSLRKVVGTGFSWHIESQSFGFHRTEDYGTTIWAPLNPIDTKRQRGGMRYVPKNIISGEYMYSYIDPALFNCIDDRIKSGGISFDDYITLRDGPLNSPGMEALLDHYAVEDDFEPGDALLLDKYVIHRSVKLEDGPLETREAFSFRFICETSRYDYARAHWIEIPREYFNTPGPTKFHLEICENDGDLIVDSSFFDGDRERRRIRGGRQPYQLLNQPPVARLVDSGL